MSLNTTWANSRAPVLTINQVVAKEDNNETQMEKEWGERLFGGSLDVLAKEFTVKALGEGLLGSLAHAVDDFVGVSLKPCD